MTDHRLIWGDAPATIVEEFPVMGIRVRFETNDMHVADIVVRAFRWWDTIRYQTDLLSKGSVRFRIHVAADDRMRDDSTCRYYMPAFDRVVVVTERSIGIADAAQRAITARVTQSLVADEEQFQYAFIQALTLSLLSRLDRQPFHAAGVVSNDVALLLSGPTGVGKSTIAYSALRDGLKVLAEDAVYIQLNPALRVWGMPEHLRLRREAIAHFPELAGQRVHALPSGKHKIVIDLEDAKRVLVVERAGLCLLERHDGPVSVEPMAPTAAVAELSASHESGFDVFRDTIGERLSHVARSGCWRLKLSGDPQDAIHFIHQMLAELRQ